MYTRAGSSSRRAVRATARPWFPSVAVTSVSAPPARPRPLALR